MARRLVRKTKLTGNNPAPGEVNLLVIQLLQRKLSVGVETVSLFGGAAVIT